MNADYQALLARKTVGFEPRGFADVPELNPAMRDHQRAVTGFALRGGCAGLFLDTGLGKTLCELDWGRVVAERANGPVLMLAPLAVGAQHLAEAARFGIDARPAREQRDVRGPAVWVTNYDRLHRFDPARFAGVVLDESSILKSFTGATTRKLIDGFAATPYRLAGTATPAPNDHMELGQHAEFLGIMPSNEMLMRWFTSDQTQMGRYRLKRPATAPFWDWMASWSRCVSLPSDLGFSDEGFVLPPLELHRHVVGADVTARRGAERDGQARLFRLPDSSATSIHAEKRLTCAARADRIAALVAAEPGEAWIIWCDTDYEADALMQRIGGAAEVRGSMPAELKEERLTAFGRGELKRLVTKPSIAGFGLNWQHCARMAFVGLSFSWEMFYQAVRRCWRFGQLRPVHVHAAMAETEGATWQTIIRKQGQDREMRAAMRAAMARAGQAERILRTYAPTRRLAVPAWMEAGHG